MTYLAIVAWGADSRVAKYQDYPTQTEAEKHVARVQETFPDAFIAEDPGGGFRNWLINPVAKTLSVVANPPPVRPTPPLTAEELYDMLETKGTLTVGDRPRPKPVRVR